MHKVKKIMVKSKGRSVDDLIDEAVNSVDQFTEPSIKLRILGLKDEEPVEEVDEYSETGHEEPDGDEGLEGLDEESKRKLLELLSESL